MASTVHYGLAEAAYKLQAVADSCILWGKHSHFAKKPSLSGFLRAYVRICIANPRIAGASRFGVDALPDRENAMNTHEGMHFVGSYPAATAREAMTAMLTRADGLLRCLPDGETGSRDRWIVGVVEAFRAAPGLRQIRDGRWSSYDDRPVFAPVRSQPLRPGDLDLGYAGAASQSYPVLRELRARHGYQDLPLQAGLPTALALSAFTFCESGAFQPSTALMHTRQLWRALAHHAVFRRTLAQEAWGIQEATAGDVVFQLELPVEVVLLSRMPTSAHPAVARALAASITRQVADAPASTRWGMHLCCGDLGNEALVTLHSVQPLVQLVNAITARWPAKYALDYVHLPFACGVQPAPSDPAAYAALADLRLPAGTRVVAGLAHENQAPQLQRRAYEAVVDVTRTLPGPPEIMISAACGLGRRTRDTANKIISHMRTASVDTAVPS